MKITNGEFGFTPVKVTLEIETQEEFDALRDMSLANESIPKLIDDYGFNATIIKDFLNDLRNALDNKSQDLTDSFRIFEYKKE